MCEAEDKLKEVYLWLRENHIDVYRELDKIEVEKSNKEAFE